MNTKSPYDTPSGLPDTDAILGGSAHKKICFTPMGLVAYTMISIIGAFILQAIVYAVNNGPIV